MVARSSIFVGAVLLVACADPQLVESDSDETTATDTGETTAPPDLPADSEESESESETTGDECPPPPCEACSCVAGQLECACAEPIAEAGFVELAARDYELGLGPDATAQATTAARQFWAYQSADLAPAEAPVFVLFNGGPGVSSGMLLGLNTGRASFDPTRTGPGQTVVENPHSWTSLGNLLWIDARHTGFSYGLLDDPGDALARDAAMSVGNFNAYRDAADFVLTLLAFLAAHPELRDNPIVLVGESYGGTRAQVMLDMLLHPSAYADGSRKLVDAQLAAEIAAHHVAVHGPSPGPAQIAEQFGRQILIQPAMTGITQQLSAGALFEQPGSVLEQFAAEFGEDYPTCAELGGACNPYNHALDFVADHGRSAYDYRAPYAWLDELFTLVRARLNDSATTEALLGVEAAAIVGLAAARRGGGWRAVDLGPYPADADVGDWPAAAGELTPWDRYFLPFNAEALSQFRGFTARLLEVDPPDPHFGELFLSNLVWVDTLITDAAYDLVVHTPALPGALESYDAWVSAVIVDPDAGEWLVEYLPERGVGSRIVTVPRYQASHAVTLDAPAQLRDDIAAWLDR